MRRLLLLLTMAWARAPPLGEHSTVGPPPWLATLWPPLNFHPATIIAASFLLRSHSLDRRKLEFPGFVTKAGRWRRRK